MVSMALAPAASADRAYSQRYVSSQKGSVINLGNTLETCTGAGPSCSDAQAGTGTKNNNDFTMDYVDIDGDASTFSSSSAQLALPPGATVTFAGLYWSADTSAAGDGAAAPNAGNKQIVKLKPPGAGSYATVTGTTDTDSLQASRYIGFADITSQVAASGAGSYTVADVQAGTGTNRFAGWSMVVAITDPAVPTVHRIQIFDGLQALDGNTRSSTDIVLNNLNTPPSGTVAARLGMVTFEGDRGLSGETATLAGTAITDALNPPDDFFNSTITSGGAYVTTKNPDYINQMGIDIDDFDETGVIGNSVTSATVHLTSTGDFFMPAMVSLITDEWKPVATAPPVVSGTPMDAQTLSTTDGTWNASAAITYSYQWQRCDSSGANCADIAGATASTYLQTPADVGSTVRVVVTATNIAGTATQTSAVTPVVQPAPPANTVLPTVTGTA
ncbi:MAG: large repetitive protein, partial [Frankiaceae bacterium]|nr:large repetitive protein [Frankiaceae bacterium]